MPSDDGLQWRKHEKAQFLFPFIKLATHDGFLLVI
jgi:hypothetical protein